jgi:hypothetical protein
MLLQTFEIEVLNPQEKYFFLFANDICCRISETRISEYINEILKGEIERKSFNYFSQKLIQFVSMKLSV